MSRLTLTVLLLALVALLAVPATASATTPWQVYTTLNIVRKKHHLRPVVICPSLRTIARRHSASMIRHDYFRHTSYDGTTFRQRVIRSSFPLRGAWWAGEVLAWTARPVGAWPLIGMWLRSPAHRAVILSRQPSCVGVGKAVGGFNHYRRAVVWTVDWGHS